MLVLGAEAPGSAEVKRRGGGEGLGVVDARDGRDVGGGREARRRTGRAQGEWNRGAARENRWRGDSTAAEALAVGRRLGTPLIGVPGPMVGVALSCPRHGRSGQAPRTGVQEGGCGHDQAEPDREHASKGP